MAFEAVRKGPDQRIEKLETLIALWVLPICAVTLAVSKLVTAQLNSHVPGATYNFDLVHHWQLILRWLLLPHRLLMAFAFLFAIVMCLVALAQKSRRLKILLFSLTLFGTLFIEWSADYIYNNCRFIFLPHELTASRLVDLKAAKEAYNIFGLDRYSVPKLMIATEIYHEELWTGFKDVYLENPYVWLTNETPLSLDLTIGPAQMKKSIIVELVREFPSELKALTESQPAQASELLPRVNLRAALDERNAAMLVGAYNASVIRRLEKGKPACADQPAPINQTIADLWKKGDPTSRATALAMSYCPAMPGHAPRVMKLLRKLESYCQSHKLEADGQLAPNCQLRDGDRD